MTAYWLLRLIVHLFSGLATCAFLFPFIDTPGREREIQRWSKRLLGICGVKVTVEETQHADPNGSVMVVSNHVSWLDIFVINSLYPCRFVAKSDIRDWPLIGWLCEKSGTIFIARGRQRDVRKIYESLVESLQQGERIAFFPEGTTAPQGKILPFHANLFEAAIEALAPVQPCAIRYVDKHGRLHRAADFVDEMSFMESITMILKSRGMTAELAFLPQISTGGAHRRELAAQAHDAVKAALGYSGD
ncbi:lysophospholipid acyltransferase family protein [Oxalobacteraceae bacterium R-40]|uniref:1-acyl-sn-glycerol-3-phosphate acyltransferase n=1 Tax=Keguizhuia sedimenti TaxID=3064264 RepID=A0ABU1BQQ0_9BURK|nr:lysophospholipid acyltransferase family protein [Oxalobacteraceae bacterium R-40]